MQSEQFGLPLKIRQLGLRMAEKMAMVAETVK